MPPETTADARPATAAAAATYEAPRPPPRPLRPPLNSLVVRPSWLATRILSFLPTSHTASGLALPALSLPLEHLPTLIPFGALANRLMHVLYDVPGCEEPMPETVPPWEKWLETWYRAFDPRIWPLLENDDAKDRQAALIRCTLLERRTADGVDSFELRDLQHEVDLLSRRIATRRARLYGASPSPL